MILALAASVLVILFLLWEQDRAGKRHHEENQAHRLQVAGLLQRIQAPETAVLQHAQGNAPAPSVTHALTDVEAAEQEEAARIIAEMERRENEMLEQRQF